MTKLSLLGLVGAAALLTAVPISPKLSLDSAEARIGRPWTATSVAGVHRRVYRRSYRRAVYAGAVGAAGYGAYQYGYGGGYPAYSSPYYGGYSSPYYGGYSYPSYSYGGYYGGYPGYAGLGRRAMIYGYRSRRW